jgi:hypothetical protein
MAFGIVDQPSALIGEIAVDPTQRLPQSAPRRIIFPAAIALKDRQDVADALKNLFADGVCRPVLTRMLL